MFHVKHSDRRTRSKIINSKPFYKKMFHVKHTCDIIDADERISAKCIRV